MKILEFIQHKYKVIFIPFLVALTFFFSGNFLVAHAALIAKPPTNLGLIGYWSFNEGTSTVVTDFSGNNNYGTTTNMANPSNATSGWINGKRGNALNFDGGNDLVRVPTNSLITDLGPMTISAWIKPRSLGGGSLGKIVVKDTALSTGYWQFFVCTNASVDTLCFSTIYGTQTLNAFAAGPALKYGEWQHVAMTWDGSQTATNVHLYINGVETTYQTQTNGSGASQSDAALDLIIGNRGDGTRAFDGLIDEVRLYNRALTASEIVTLYNTKSYVIQKKQGVGTDNGLVGHWTFDGVRTDFAKNILYGLMPSNDATLANMSTTSSLAIGKIGQAFNFDGSDDLISTPVNDSLLPENQPVTISAWIYPRTRGENNQGRIVQRGTATGGVGFYLSSAGTNGIQFLASGVADVARRSSDNTITLGQWQHVLVTWDGSTTGANIHMYVNGVETSYAATINGSSITDNSTEPVRIGNSTDGTRTFDGYIDDLRMYNRVLSQEEITRLSRMAQGKVNTSPTIFMSDGLVGYWPFDGKYMDWSKNEVLDASGNNRTGTSTNLATTSVVRGKIGQALRFNGSNSRVSFPTTVFDGTGNSPVNAITISAWIKTVNTAAVQAIASKYTGGGARPFQFRIQSGNLRFGLYNGTTETVLTTASLPISSNNWYHVLAVWDGSLMSIYVDGAFVQSTAFTGPISYTGSTNLGIGYTGSDNFPFDGLIDEVRIYNRALSLSEILRLYNTEK